MSLRGIFLAAFAALPLVACNTSWDEGPATGTSDQEVGIDHAAPGQRPAGVTRIDVRNTPALWANVSGQGLTAGALTLTADEGFRPLRQIATEDGLVHARAQQTYRGVPIWGEQLITTSTAQGQVVRMYGNLIGGLDAANLDVTPAISARRALADMKAEHSAALGGAKPLYQNESSELVIYLDGDQPVLAYAVSFFADSGAGEPTRPTYLVDANTGDVLFQFEGLTTAEIGTGPGGNQKTGQYEYGTDFGFNDVAVSGSTCTMNNANVKTVNLNHGTSGSTAYSYTCPRNTVKTINGAFSPLNDAHFFGGVVFNMYQDWIGVAPLTFQLTMRVHYSNNYQNAFWDGSAMTFGDGGSTFYPLVSLDVASHEVSHGFTEQNSGLIYSGQSGGINEAFSDIAGEAAENYMNGTNDFLVGAQIFKASGALRYMHNPPLDGSSIGHASNYFPGMDVHYSSGVFNKAFYLLATTAGWSTQSAFQAFARANQTKWGPSTNFQQGAQGVLDAAGELGFDTGDVSAAFAQVGISVGGGGGPVCGNGVCESGEDANNCPADCGGGGGPSCVGSCGGPSPDGCWCDDLCTGYGDCCPDYEQVCNGGSTCTPVSDSISGISGARLSQKFYTEEVVDPGCSTLTVKIAGGSGDADVYVKFGSQPTTTSYDCRPYTSGNNETCTFNNPQQGTYHIMIRGYTAYSGVTLSTDIQ